jgi:hypothetical protein
MSESTTLHDTTSPASPQRDPTMVEGPEPVALQTLTALAGGLCADAGLRVLPSAQGWSCGVTRREIYVPVGDLDRIGLLSCAGVLAHECGHALITTLRMRDPLVERLAAAAAELLEPPLAAQAGACVSAFGLILSNALEDGRCESFMIERYPGCAPWLRAASLSLRGDALAGRLYVMQVMTLMADLRVQSPDEAEWGFCVDAVPAAVLRSAWPTVARYRSVRPDADLRGPADHVENAALAAGGVAAELAPVVLALLLEDARWLAGFGPPAQQRAALSGAARDLPSGGVPLTVENVAHAMKLIVGELQPTSVGPACARSEGAEEGSSGAGTSPGGARVDPRDPRALVAGLAKALARSFEAARPGLLPTLHRDGAKPHLPAVMRREADPRASDRVWARSPPPMRRWAAVSLLVDLSGSMRGEKVAAAKLGAEACALALATLDVTFALHGFQDVLIPLLPFGVHRPATVLRATRALELEVRGERPDGNNRPENNDDGPCVDEAARALSRRSEPDRLLVVISDGLPEGSRSTAEDLRVAVRRWTGPRSPIRIVALGIGPRTEHVRDYYPDAIAGVDPMELPRALTETLHRRLRSTRSARAVV